MEEEENNQGKAWIVWALIPVCMVLTIMFTLRLMRGGASSQSDPGTEAANSQPLFQDTPIVPQYKPLQQEAEAGPQQQERTGYIVANGVEALSESEEKAPSSASGQSGRPVSAAPSAAANDKKLFDFTYKNMAGALIKAANNPKVLGMILNNDLVVKGFMSLPKVKAATSSKAALSAYFKDPRNINEWIKKPSVKAAYEDPAAFSTAAESKLMGELLTSPAANELLADPNEISAILTANPGLMQFLTDPKFVAALTNNPNTAGALARLNTGGQ